MSNQKVEDGLGFGVLGSHIRNVWMLSAWVVVSLWWRSSLRAKV